MNRIVPYRLALATRGRVEMTMPTAQTENVGIARATTARTATDGGSKHGLSYAASERRLPDYAILATACG